MKKLYKTTLGILVFGLLATLACHAGTPILRVEVEFHTQSGSSYTDEPVIVLRNVSPTAQIHSFEIKMEAGTGEEFDFLQSISVKAGSGITYKDVIPDEKNGGARGDTFSLGFNGFDPGEWVRMELDIDGGDYRDDLFNEHNATITITGPSDSSESFQLPDKPGGRSYYEFEGGTEQHIVIVKSRVERIDSDEPPDSAKYVRQVIVTVRGDDDTVLNTYTNFGIENVKAYEGSVIEVTCPPEVYRDIHGVDVSDMSEILAKAEERFTAIGISVNNEVQTGDPTFYRFTLDGPTDIVVKWRHEYALTVEQSFIQTASTDIDAAGDPWAGPLTSWATGNPVPSAKKHWVTENTIIDASIDGQVVDFSRPGLEVRYVPLAYRAYGPPNHNTSESQDADTIAGNTTGIDAHDVLDETEEPFTLAPLPARQQVGGQAHPTFRMYGPGGITYVWQIQYGVKVNVDDIDRTGLPRIYEKAGGTWDLVGTGEGTFWFNPGRAIKVASKANVADVNSTALKGWFNGDGHYFSDTGDIDETNSGELSDGGPVSGAASWQPVLDNAHDYRGMHISQLHRSVRVMWRYGPHAIAVNATIGQYVFQGTPEENVFTTEPDQIALVTVDGLNPNVGEADMTVWDPVAARLYPVVPGIVRARWRPDPESSDSVDVLITATYPAEAHYPHIVGAPPVALDPDPDDSFVFKEVKYTESDGVVDSDNSFTASQAGKSVLLFGELQLVGRGQPREFLRVRVVDSKDWNTGLPDSHEAIIGQKITDSELDLAGMGTGYLVFKNARYNPFIYDAVKLEKLAAQDIYDMDVLRSDSAEKIVISPEALPGPIIPVNLHPSAADDERIVIAWYDDPAKNDELLWPHATRLYKPRWPRNASEGLGRIVIASQFGSDCVGADGADQLTVEAITNVIVSGDGSLVTNIIPAETLYNPSRLQQVQVYSQPDPSSAGYNPNEEHALLAPSLRYADVSPPPPAAFALRDGDLNDYNTALDEANQGTNYTSHPFVLVQYQDTADGEFKMRVYNVRLAAPEVPGYRLVNADLVTPGSGGTVATTPRGLQAEPHVVMKAGEPVIPFYPLVHVIGAAPSPETYGLNIKGQQTYWEDHKDTSWSISGGENAWFTHHVYYRMAPDFWWPPNKPGFIYTALEQEEVVGRVDFPQTGDSVAFLPPDISTMLNMDLDGLAYRNDPPEFDPAGFEENSYPSPILYLSEWPDNPAILKAGETLTFQGGENRADDPLTKIVNDAGEIEEVETPGLPAVVAFATAELVFDSLNPQGTVADWESKWTARVAQVLETRSVPLSLAEFPSDLQPATQRTRVKSGKYVFNDLPSSLQKRVLFDPIGGKLVVIGLLNDKDIGDTTLTAAPPAVYVLEPNIITAQEEEELLKLSPDNEKWTATVADLAKLSRNPSLIAPTSFTGRDNDDTLSPGSLGDRSELEEFWTDYYQGLSELSATAPVPTPVPLDDIIGGYYVGLEPKVLRDGSGNIITIEDPLISGLRRVVSDPRQTVPLKGFGPGLALVPNDGFLDPTRTDLPDISWITVVENNDPSLGGSPITPHVIKVDRRKRYRGAIKTIESDNVFDENLVLRHQGDFGANADELVFEWWYRPDDGSLNVPPPDLIEPGQTNPWKLFPDPTGERGKERFQITLAGNPNAPEALIADTWWFCRYRHKKDVVQGTDWNVQQEPHEPDEDSVNFTWAGAGNSDPFHDFDGDGLMDYRAQLAMGWIKRVLDAVNPYEARIRDFEGDSPATVVSMIRQFGARFEGPVALNPAKNVIENVGLIELYETILKRGMNLTINLSRPVSTPAIANALQLASTRISDFYTILGNEAYGDAIDPSIGHGSESAAYGHLAPAIFAFQNQMSSLIEEELGLLRGVDDYFARPVYNRLFWNFTKGEGEAAYAVNYDISDANSDGFVDEDDAMIMYPQGHGDAWGHYLTAVRNQYDLLNHKYFNWVSRSEFYNLMDIVIKVDFLDERKFAQMAAARAKTGTEIVDLTYREKYVEDPVAQWQGYTDANKDRSWGVQGWARRAGQGAYFDWITANALLPSEHPNEELEGIQRVARSSNSDIPVVSANLNSIQKTFDNANNGFNPLGLSGDVVPFDLNPEKIESLRVGRSHFEQLYDRAIEAMKNATAVWDNANKLDNMLRKMGNTEAQFKNKVYQEDLSYRNRLISTFGKPYEGTIGSGKLYPAGYNGPDTLLFMYVDVRKIDNTTVPGPTTAFAEFDDNTVIDGDIYTAFDNGLLPGVGSYSGGSAPLADISHPFMPLYLNPIIRRLYAPTFVPDRLFDPESADIMARDGLYAVNYTELDAAEQKVPLDRLDMLMPVTAAGYTFQAPRDWGARLAIGELQILINQMIQQEAQVAKAIGSWDGLQGDIIRTMRIINARLSMNANFRLKNELFSRFKLLVNSYIAGVEAVRAFTKATTDSLVITQEVAQEAIPKMLPIIGTANSPGDAASAARAASKVTKIVIKSGGSLAEATLDRAKVFIKIGFDIAENEFNLWEGREKDALAAKEMLKGLENKVGDEPIKRIAIFKELEALRLLSEKYRAKVDLAVRMLDQRAAYNKRVSAQTQRSRYQDMTFRVNRNHALQNYRASFDLAARYTYLAAKAYDYETNLTALDPASPSSVFNNIVRARGLGQISGGAPQMGKGGLAESLAWLKINHAALKGQLGFDNPQAETGKMSLRTELFRILPKGATQPGVDGFPGVAGNSSDVLWQETLLNAQVEDLWMLPEYRYFCRPFASESDGSGTHVEEPGIVLKFGTTIKAGENFFGMPLSGADHAFDPSHFATKIRSVGMWFSDYHSTNVLSELPSAPRIYLVPTGTDVMRVARADNPDAVRLWNVVDQRIPVPLPAVSSELDRANWIPLMDSLNGRLGDPRKFSAIRAYHDSGNTEPGELVFSTRLVSRSVWNTEWMIIIPGRLLNSDPKEGLRRFIDQVSDIKLLFEVYGYSGN